MSGANCSLQFSQPDLARLSFVTYRNTVWKATSQPISDPLSVTVCIGTECHFESHAPCCHFEPCASLFNDLIQQRAGGIREQLTHLRFECHFESHAPYCHFEPSAALLNGLIRILNPMAPNAILNHMLRAAILNPVLRIR
jgi:hypothetical protein